MRKLGSQPSHDLGGSESCLPFATTADDIGLVPSCVRSLACTAELEHARSETWSRQTQRCGKGSPGGASRLKHRLLHYTLLHRLAAHVGESEQSMVPRLALM